MEMQLSKKNSLIKNYVIYHVDNLILKLKLKKGKNVQTKYHIATKKWKKIEKIEIKTNSKLNRKLVHKYIYKMIYQNVVKSV